MQRDDNPKNDETQEIITLEAVDDELLASVLGGRDYGWRGGGWQLREAPGDFTPFEVFDDDFDDFGDFGGFEDDDWGDFGGFGGGGFGGW